MELCPGGIDVFYIDESHDSHLYVVTAVAIPFLRNVNGAWHIVWGDCHEAAKAFRREVKQQLTIPTTEELHAQQLIRGRGKLKHGKWNFKWWEAVRAYTTILGLLDDFIPESSVMSVSGTCEGKLYGSERLEMVLHGLFQRMRRQSHGRQVNAFVFFDEGHPEYRRFYRRARVYLPTGSARGLWDSGEKTMNLALDMFTKDANEKNSKHCLFTQAADLIAYAAFLKRQGELGRLQEWQREKGLGALYDHIPSRILSRP
jgi:hypothetical protein